MGRKRDKCGACGQVHAEGTLICPITGVSLRFSDPKKAVGEVVGGKYRITRALGRGGMGAVYEARHIELEKKVAIKILLPEALGKPQQVERFKREARSAASIGHENIVDIFDLDKTEDGSVYIVMELLVGQDLADTLDQSPGPLGIGRIGAIALQTALGLGAAHEHGIIHRDLKPENIFLARKPAVEQVKIVDFGIAMMRSQGDVKRLTAEGVLIGTPFYMSPEQARGERELDPTVDVYALGAVIYEMLTGAVLFEGDTYLEILAKHQVDPPPPLRERNPDVECPRDVEDLLMAMLEKDRSRRPQDMQEVVSALAPHADLPGHVLASLDERTSAEASSAPSGQKAGFEETLIAYQSSPSAAPGASDARTGAPGTASGGVSLEWSADGEPSPTREPRPRQGRTLVVILASAAGLLLAATVVAALLLSGVMGPRSGRAARAAAHDPTVGTDPASDEPGPGEDENVVLLDFEARPPIAIIEVDGRALDGNPARFEAVPGSTHVVEVMAPDHEPMRKEITADGNRAYSWNLVPLEKDVAAGKTKVVKPPRPPHKPGPPHGETATPTGGGAGSGGGSGGGATKSKKIKVDKDNPYLTGG